MKKTRPLNQEKREAIVKAAIEEFYTKGYEGSSMDTISKEANVSKSTIYNHFKNKEDLFMALTFILKERFEEAFKYKYQKEKELTTQLSEIAYKELEFLNDEENIKLIQTTTVAMIQKNEMGLKLLELAKDNYQEMTAMWFEKAKEDGKLNFKNSSFVSKQFIGMIKSFAFYPQMYGAAKLSKNEQKELVKESIDMIIKLYSNN